MTLEPGYLTCSCVEETALSWAATHDGHSKLKDSSFPCQLKATNEVLA